MKRSTKYFLAISTGVLLTPAWYEWGTGLFLLFALVPLLWLENILTDEGSSSKRVFLYTSLAILIWNLLTTWWIKNASGAGLIIALLISTSLMILPIWFYSIIKKLWGKYIGYTALVIFWLACEFSYTHGEIAWPWLTLGNGFAFNVKLIQWYEYTGVFGGTLWVLVVNILIFELLQRYSNGIPLKKNRILIGLIMGVVLVPITFSLVRYYTYTEIENPREIVIIQPNIDPYLKFNDIPSLEQTSIQVELAEEKITPTTDYVIAPETSIGNNIWIDKIKEVPDIQMVKHLVLQHPQVNYVVGIMCYKSYLPSERTITSKELFRSGLYYDSFNSAIQIDSTDSIPIYHKSQLVVGVEKMPYPKYFRLLEKAMVHLGGTFRSHGTQKERAVFARVGDSVKVAPVICYESIFGEFVTGYIKKGGNMIFVITNDGWWGNTPGYRQHNSLSCLRAIETRRSIARSANTGISSFINQRGDVIESMGWWQRGSMRNSLNINSAFTFYVKQGDYIARGAFWISWLILTALILKQISERFNK